MSVESANYLSKPHKNGAFFFQKLCAVYLKPTKQSKRVKALAFFSASAFF
jgi:hypothetical protein